VNDELNLQFIAHNLNFLKKSLSLVYIVRVAFTDTGFYQIKRTNFINIINTNGFFSGKGRN
jgi:hypothetical protein